MHSSIIGRVLSTIFDWMLTFEYPWDSISFTIWDIFIFACVATVGIYFLKVFIGSIFAYFGVNIDDVTPYFHPWDE